MKVENLTKQELEAILAIPYTANAVDGANIFTKEQQALYNEICESFGIEEENLEVRFWLEQEVFAKFSEACFERWKELRKAEQAPTPEPQPEPETNYIYEFVTPSDTITFRAATDKVAFAVAILLGNGKAGCKREGANLGTMIAFAPGDPINLMHQWVGMDFGEFLKQNRPAIKNAFESFAYVSLSGRVKYEAELAACSEDASEEFKLKHEDRNRTSMNKWVKHAWSMSERIE